MASTRSVATTVPYLDSPGVTPEPHDAAFEKYAIRGAYHWQETSRSLRRHNAFTMERYRRTLRAARAKQPASLLDYGCGDGAFLGFVARQGHSIELHGYDPNDEAVRLAASELAARGIVATIHKSPDDVPDAYFDLVICADVIEHVNDPTALLIDLDRALAPGGTAVVTTPVRATEHPLDRNHAREWFPGDFAAFLTTGPLALRAHEQAIPVAAAEVYFWRPRVLLRLPFFRLVCNVLSIHFGRDALTALGLPDRRAMLQLAVLEKRR
jgi:SAM-dependent methyltransferase